MKILKNLYISVVVFLNLSFLIFLSCPGITVLLSLTVFMLLVAEIMPATSDSVPLIGKNRLLKCCNNFFSPKLNGFASLNKNKLAKIDTRHVTL